MFLTDRHSLSYFLCSLPLCCRATHNASCLSAQGTMVFQMRAWEGKEWIQNQTCGQPFRMCHCSVGNRKGFATDKKRKFTFCQGGITKPSTKILAQSINIDITNIFYGIRQWDILKTECDTLNVYQEKNGLLNGGICILLWDIMQLNEKNLQRNVFSMIYLKQTLMIFKVSIFLCVWMYILMDWCGRLPFLKL